jgi:hypothetical protein
MSTHTNAHDLPMDIAFYRDHDCPLATPVRADLVELLDELGIPYRMTEHVDAGRLSPTVLVDGTDLLDPQPQPAALGCRITPPARSEIRAALGQIRKSKS